MTNQYMINPSCLYSEIDIENAKIFNKKIWRISDVAKVLGVSVGHIYNLISASKKMRRKNDIPYRKCGKLLFFFPEEVLSWVDCKGA